MSSLVRAVVPCRMGFRDGVGALLEALCGGLSASTMYRVVSAFNEAFNNVVLHSQLAVDDPIEIEATRESRRLMVRVMDDGVAYPDVELEPFSEGPEAGGGEPELRIEELSERGMGLLIIRRCMDEVSYQRHERNVFTMVKHLAVDDGEAHRTQAIEGH